MATHALNLLAALDVLPSERSVIAAARRLGLSFSAMSRTLTRLRLATSEDLGSIFLDPDLAAAASQPSLQHMSMISASMLRAKTNGISSIEELEDLIPGEDDLYARNTGNDAIHVGRPTARGSHVFYFYTANPEALGAAYSQTMAQHPDYQFQVTSGPSAMIDLF